MSEDLNKMNNGAELSDVALDAVSGRGFLPPSFDRPKFRPGEPVEILVGKLRGETGVVRESTYLEVKTFEYSVQLDLSGLIPLPEKYLRKAH